VPTERQLAANRLNALRSTGPRSDRGKRRASRNSYRHGLSVESGGDDLGAIEDLARKIAGPDADPIGMELARHAAEAELTVRRISQTKTRLINRILTFGEFQIQEPSIPKMPRRDLWNYLEMCRLTETFPRPPDGSKTLPKQLSARVAEAIRRALSALNVLEKYELRAAGRRDAAVRRLLARGTPPESDG